MSEQSQGDGWWMASDGKWYPPHLHPDYTPPPRPASTLAPPPLPPTSPPLSTGWGSPSSQSASGSRRRSGAWIWVGLACVVVAAVAIIGAVAGQEGDVDLGAVATKAFAGTDVVVIGDHDSVEFTLVDVDHNEVVALDTVLDEAGFRSPRSLRLRMANTRALDGMQSAEAGDVRLSWTYHPDDGLSIIMGRE